MLKLIFSSITLLLFTTTFSQNITGNWEGAAQIQGTELPIVFHITKDDNGKYSATFDSPKQKAYNIACSDVIINGDSVIILIKVINGRYAGKLSNDNINITGNMYQGGAAITVNLFKTSNVSTIEQLNRPQTPKPPYPYKSEDVEYDNADKSVHFGATFTVPLPDPNVDYFRAPVYPTVILITGSGKQDRDVTLYEHKPFAVIADYLTRQGIAVLRVDDRDMGKTTGDFSKSTSADFANDVEAGIEYLKTRADVDVNTIGLIGHSEGGIIAPMVASKRTDVRFIVLLAGPGIRILDMMEQQSADIMISTGVSKADADIYRPLYKNIIAAILNANDSADGGVKAMEVFKKWQKNTPASTVRNTTGITDEKSIGAFVNTFVSQLNSPWFRYFLKFNPADYLSKTNCPVLALNGGKDIQIAAKPNLTGIKDALQKNKNKNFKTIELPGLNHLFQHCKTCTVEEYGELEESFDTETLKIISDWIKNESTK